jgi:hypothetical protein
MLARSPEHYLKASAGCGSSPRLHWNEEGMWGSLPRRWKETGGGVRVGR